MPLAPTHRRRAAATVEFAVVLPLLAFLFLIVIDYCRIFYFAQIVSNCSRNGALYASDPIAAAESPYASLQDAATADAGATLKSKMGVSSQSGSDSMGNYVRVTVTYPFQTLTTFPGLPHEITLSRTAEVRVASATPQ